MADQVFNVLSISSQLSVNILNFSKASVKKCFQKPMLGSFINEQKILYQLTFGSYDRIHWEYGKYGSTQFIKIFQALGKIYLIAQLVKIFNPWSRVWAFYVNG
tara:strand:+ start:539 stop:847 length:309 start_codon:yes stop_codon:yes gene_type:complete